MQRSVEPAASIHDLFTLDQPLPPPREHGTLGPEPRVGADFSVEVAAGGTFDGRWGDEVKLNPVKQALRAGKPQVGTWLSLGSVVAARFLARTGLPWLTVDMEHTHTDINTAAMMFGVIADAGCVPLCRILAGRHDLIKSVLDCGAMGIVAPMVMTPAEARSIVAATKYPPKGNRSVGGGLHAMNYATTAEQYYNKADDEILVVIQTEHISAVEIADEIYSVPGIDAIFVGPNDLAASMRDAEGTWPTKARLDEVLTRIREAAARNRVPVGLHVFSIEDAKRRIAEGWQFIAVNSELKMMLQGASALAEAIHPELSAGELAKY
jgi:4-hydroxy-2-oxoheptanedioate aldolase